MLSLWCEWPTQPHPLDNDAADYPIDTIPEGLTRYLPYLRQLIAILSIVAPGVLVAGFGERAQAAVEAATATMEFIDDRLSKQETDPRIRQFLRDTGGPYRGLHAAGADFRALREVLNRLESEHHKNWGGLSPVSRPEDRRVVYLCPEHMAELDYPYTTNPVTP